MLNLIKESNNLWICIILQKPVNKPPQERDFRKVFNKSYFSLRHTDSFSTEYHTTLRKALM